MWNLTCEKENCLSNSLKARAITPKQNRYFDINRAAVLAFRSIGKGHSGAKKVASILNIDKPINAHSWRGHTEAISECSEKIVDVNLKLEAHNAKLYLCKTGQLNITENELNDHNAEISARFDGSWNTRGWSSRTGIVDACSEPTGKVLDVITKFSHCKICQEKKSKYDAHQMTTLQYLTWCTDHESKCLMNHEGSASSVSDTFKYIHTIFISTQMQVLLYRSQILNALVSHCSI